ncbi:diguanylate cyclase domain-containing protein [Salipaludibacillus sp. HK11]|uniref:sensor domain-containing diguanylate cyclase n=1 Tax=Salipaludibacillus sp. HK11 TaxID=3394320 RepID=UPI0039FCD8FE
MKHYLLLLCLFITIILQACSIPNENVDTSFIAIDGELDLSEWDNEKSLINLNGQWDLYWNQLLDPTDFKSESKIKQTDVIDIPSVWHTQSLDGEPLPKEGFATYRLEVSMNEINEVMGLKIPYMQSNFNLWIDDKLLATNGQVGTNGATSVPEKKPQVVYFSPKNKTFFVTLQISNYDYDTGGLLEPIILGKSENIHHSYFYETILQSILLGVLIFSGIYHISLGFFRRIESYFFYFGAYCLVAAFRYSMIGNVYFTKIFSNIDWDLAMKLEFISLYSHIPLLGMVLYLMYRKHRSNWFTLSSKWFTLSSIIVTIFFGLLTIFTTAQTYLSFIVYFHFYMIIAVFYVLTVAINSLKEKQEGSYYLITGLAFLMTTVLLDIFTSLNNSNTPESNFYPIGIIVFIICFSLVLSKRLSSSLNLSVELTEDLSQLNSELETKVEQRTQQIQQSNKKLAELNEQLEKMALIDGLTNIPNRRQFDKHYKQQYEICAQEKTPLSILFIDIDYFKNYNDYYGHQQGDECLKLVAQSLKEERVNKSTEGLVARYGGEEFVYVIPQLSKEEAEQFAEILNQKIEKLEIVHEKSLVSNYVTVSIGLITVIPNTTEDMNSILKKADHALYQAKIVGRNQVCSAPIIE